MQDTIQGPAEQYGVSDICFGPVNEDGRISVKLLLNDDNRQVVLNSIQPLLQASENAKIILSIRMGNIAIAAGGDDLHST